MPGPVYLRGDGVELRTVEEEDVGFLHRTINDRRLWEGFGAPGPRSRHEVRERFEAAADGEGEEAFLVCRDGEPEGRVRLVDIDRDWGNAELTCYVVPASQREGLATAACRCLVGYAFDHLPVNRITARVFASNEASRGLAEKLGFEHEGTLREHVYHGGRYVDLRHYGLLADEFRGDGNE